MFTSKTLKNNEKALNFVKEMLNETRDMIEQTHQKFVEVMGRSGLNEAMKWYAEDVYLAELQKSLINEWEIFLKQEDAPAEMLQNELNRAIKRFQFQALREEKCAEKYIATEHAQAQNLIKLIDIVDAML